MRYLVYGEVEADSEMEAWEAIVEDAGLLSYEELEDADTLLELREETMILKTSEEVKDLLLEMAIEPDEPDDSHKMKLPEWMKNVNKYFKDKHEEHMTAPSVFKVSKMLSKPKEADQGSNQE